MMQDFSSANGFFHLALFYCLFQSFTSCQPCMESPADLSGIVCDPCQILPAINAGHGAASALYREVQLAIHLFCLIFIIFS
jgi:hypothetical protein